MADFALVEFDSKIVKKDILFNIGLFKSRFGSKLFYLFNRNYLKTSISKIEIYENLNAWKITLPISITKLYQVNKDFLIKYIERAVSNLNLNSCYLPKKIYDYLKINNSILKKEAQNVIFKSMIMPILYEIYTNNGFNIANLDIVIATENDNEELVTLIKLMEPHIKYITVVTKNDDDLENRLTDIFADCGLSISVSSNYRGIMRNADLVINLGNPQIITGIRMGPKSLLINYNTESCKMRSENIVINGFEYVLPTKLYQNFNSDIYNNYSKKRLSNIIITQMLEIGDAGSLEYENVIKIQEELKKIGCKITGFNGRRGILSVENIIKAING